MYIKYDNYLVENIILTTSKIKTSNISQRQKGVRQAMAETSRQENQNGLIVIPMGISTINNRMNVIFPYALQIKCVRITV